LLVPIAVSRLPDLARALRLGFVIDGGASSLSPSYPTSEGLRVVVMDSLGRHWSARVDSNGRFRLLGWGRPRAPLTIALCDPARPNVSVLSGVGYAGSDWVLERFPPRFRGRYTETSISCRNI